ncbi:MAG: hypothetical protein EOP39_14730 [Rubrivivax sp.]|nr:MAG: hypothetical protein EOP39_14730 [Rubrivivax sp.]
MRPTASQLLWSLPLAAMGSGLLAALWPAGEPAPTAIAAATAMVTPSHEMSLPLVAATVPTVATAARANTPDPVQALSAEERQALQTALAHHPSREAEIRRVAGFMQLQRQVEAWRASRTAQADLITRRALAAPIEAALPAALADRSVSTGEALQLQAQLIADREPDAARASTELAAWRSRHVPPADAPDREFLAQQQVLVATYASQPDKLEPALDALRRKHFPSPN